MKRARAVSPIMANAIEIDVSHIPNTYKPTPGICENCGIGATTHLATLTEPDKHTTTSKVCTVCAHASVPRGYRLDVSVLA